MAMQKITPREQILILIVIGIFVGGAYALMRYVPQTKVLNDLSTELKKAKQQVKNPKFPEEPEEDIGDLKDKELELEAQLNTLRISMQSEQSKLAPTNQNQDVLLKISEAARVAGVKVVESVPYLVQRIDGNINTAKVKLSRRQLRNKAKAARTRRNSGASPIATPTNALGAIPKEGELIYELVNNLDEARPLQRLSLEGSFRDIQSFIKALSIMQYQVTVVKLDIDVKFQTPPQGVPQPLMAKMIIAM